ncbi:hypothetical protein [Pseudoalteromonas sp. GB56]
MKNKVAVIFALLLSLFFSPLVVAHLCHLKATVVESILTILVSLIVVYFVSKAASKRNCLLSFITCTIFSFSIYSGYSTWLHSEAFPVALLDAESVKKQNELQEIRESVNLTKQ